MGKLWNSIQALTRRDSTDTADIPSFDIAGFGGGTPIGPTAPLPVQPFGGATPTAGAVTVAATSTLIIAAGSTRLRVKIFNNGSVNIFVGPSVATTSMYLIQPGGRETFITQGAIYGIAASGTCDTRYFTEAQ